MSSLGLNMRGEVRSASEFKALFEDFGQSFDPYKCPFCEVPYEDRCIVTECVKAPHFKLPNGTVYRNNCNGEAGENLEDRVGGTSGASKRRVVGEIELPEALVKRKIASKVRKVGDDGIGSLPDGSEIARRKKVIAADKTISSNYTTSQLRPIVHAFLRLKKHAYEKAIAAKLKQGSAEYNTSFRTTLSSHKLNLYGRNLNYGNAFQNSRLAPWHEERIYHGTGKVEVDGNDLIIRDAHFWPKLPKAKEHLASFRVRIDKKIASNATTSQQRSLKELEDLATTGQDIQWYAFGLPILLENGFELVLDSLDHIYWSGQHRANSLG